MFRSNILYCSVRKMLWISCEFLPWKMSQTYSIYNIHVTKTVLCLHKAPYKNGLQSQKASINSTGTREASETHNTDVFQWVDGE